MNVRVNDNSEPLISGRAAFTIAFGSDIYFRMAYALARSFLLHGTKGDIDFVIVADRPVSERPADLTAVRWIEVPPGAYGRGFSPKLHLEKLAPAERSLFIDADCLCVASLEPIFEAFEGRSVSVVGTRISDGEWFGDVAAICLRFGFQAYPRFNGGVYYIEPSAAACAVYATARDVEECYDEIGLVRLRGAPNDEVCMAIAMEKHGLLPVPDDGTIMNTMIDASAGFRMDIISGYALLRNRVGGPQSDPFQTLSIMRPAIVHFLGRDPSEHPYRTQLLLLELTAIKGWSNNLARAWVFLCSALPSRVFSGIKATLRPIYRSAFGVRRQKSSPRATWGEQRL